MSGSQRKARAANKVEMASMAKLVTAQKDWDAKATAGREAYSAKEQAAEIGKPTQRARMLGGKGKWGSSLDMESFGGKLREREACK